ncbi:SPOR domain-containing protein [Pseudoalteromonas sp. JBTF-M23]|uniref:SPOR domain-containing protein n=1 Tax=Pseudoalteromonas caenipelagi TaxID=2726988 RepID=A0A849VCM9_9GAMM|nr:SPOR domain-containing protein [Pseudoalteromonas caenipelagi]NOU51142.1 SPOR domain-containing protein [Pseudoalteromonas caenipelagi]
MAQHDYINRKPKSNKGSKNTAPKKPFPTIMSLAALLLVGGFAYGLWYIKHNAEPEKIEAVAKPAKTEAPKLEKPVIKPFLEEIKEHEVKVEVKEIKSKGPYQMQCASTRTRAQAEEIKAKIAFAGLIAEIRRTEGSNGVWYRVRLGPYDTLRQAESDKNKLKRVKITGCGIWGWTP